MIEVLCGDCREFFPKLRRKFDFVFADPPFNVGYKYPHYDDKMPPTEYQRFTTEWISVMWRCLNPGAAFVIHGCVKIRPVLWRSLIGLGIDHHYENEIAQHYRFGQCRRSDWVDNHCCAIVLRKPGGVRKWYPEQVLIESDRATKYGDTRVHETERGGKRVPGTVFGVPSDGEGWGRVQGNNRERCKDAANQLPEVYLARLIRAYSQEGDSIADPFCGSATTAVVASALGRHCVTTDVSPLSCKQARQRLSRGAVRV